jgi:putative transposase
MGQKYRKSSHGLYDLKAHIVWITKYRYPVLTSQIAIRLRELVRKICADNNVEIISGVISPKHVHILISYPPNISVSKLAQFIKGTTSRKLQQEFPQLGKKYWGQHLWARGFFAVSTGNVTTEMIQNYIKNHKDDDEEFTISKA